MYVLKGYLNRVSKNGKGGNPKQNYNILKSCLLTSVVKAIFPNKRFVSQFTKYTAGGSRTCVILYILLHHASYNAQTC